MRAGWGDEGSAGDNERGSEDDGEMWRSVWHLSSAFAPFHQKDEKTWKHQGWIHLKDTDEKNLSSESESWF